MVVDKVTVRDSHEQGQKWDFLRRCGSSKGFLVVSLQSL